MIGLLHRACRAFLTGRAFLRRMIDYLYCFLHRTHSIRVIVEFRRDLRGG